MVTVPEEVAEQRRHSPGRRVRNKILRGSMWVFIAKFLGAVAGIGVNGLLARMLGKSDTGLYFQAFSIVTIGSTIAALGMDRAVVRVVASSLATAKPGRAREGMRITFAFGAMGSLLLGAALLVGGGNFLAHHVFKSPGLTAIIIAIVAWLIASTFQTLVGETFRGFKQFRAASIFGELLTDFFAAAVFVVLYFRHSYPSVSEAILIMVGAISVSVLVGGGILGGRMSHLKGRGVIDTREMLGISMPLLAVSMSSFLVGTGVDIWVVGHFEPNSQVALYGAASRLVFFVATPFIIVSQVVPPIIAQLWEQGRKSELEHSLRSVATLAGIPAAGVLALFLVAGGWVMNLVYGSGYAAGAEVLAILSVARLFAVATGSSGVAMTMTGHQRTMMRITLSTGILSLCLELAMVKPFGIIGVAVATCIAQILQNLLQLFYTKKHLGIWTHVEFSLKPLLELAGR